jgi:hypothetical protein
MRVCGSNAFYKVLNGVVGGLEHHAAGHGRLQFVGWAAPAALSCDWLAGTLSCEMCVPAGTATAPATTSPLRLHHPLHSRRV